MARSLPAATRGRYGFAQFVQVGKGLQDQEVDTGLEQRVDLFAKGRPRFGERRGTERFDAHAQRPNRAGHKDAVLGRFARQTDRRLIDGFQFLRDSESGQPHPAGAVGVGFENLRAGFGVLQVNLAHHVGLRQVQLVEAPVDEHTARVQHGAHGAIRDEDAPRQLIPEFLSAILGSDGHGRSYKLDICDFTASRRDNPISPRRDLPFQHHPHAGQDGEHLVERNVGLVRGGVVAIETVEKIVGMVGQVDHFSVERRPPPVVRPGLVDAEIGALVRR
jgi:hypothetical protein